MKAIVLKQFGETGNFELGEIEEPQLLEGTVKVKIMATAFNPIDYQMRKGSRESKLLTSSILGREMAGLVTEVHPSVREFKVGDEVFGYVSNLGSNGTYAEYVVVPTEIIALKPKSLNFNEATAIPLVGLTAIQAVERCSVTEHDTVFVTGGAGGVGSMVIRLLLSKGLKNIFTTAGNESSLEKIVAYGLPSAHIINYKNGDIAGQFRKISPKQADICIDTVGFNAAEACAEIIKINGIFADVAFLSTEKARDLLFDKGVSIINISNYAYGLERDREKMKYYGDRLQLIGKYLDEKIINSTPVKIIGDLSVETVNTAHKMLENNETNGYKLVMTVG